MRMNIVLDYFLAVTTNYKNDYGWSLRLTVTKEKSRKGLCLATTMRGLL